MQTIVAFATQAASAIAPVASTAIHAVSTVGQAIAGVGKVAGAGQAVGAAAQGVSMGTRILQGLRIGTSVVSALSTYQQGQLQAEGLRQDAFNEDLQGRQEFIQNMEKANLIEQAYNETVQQQLAVAGASGIDINSGSVQDARAAARAQADRQLTIDRNGTEMNAALRRGRASYLTYAAGATAQAGALGALSKVGGAVFDSRRAA